MALSGIKKTQKREHVSVNAAESDTSGSDSDDSSASAPETGNAGWADSIAKVLNTTKPKTKKTLVLSRAKKNKLCKTENANGDIGFEIDGELQDEKPNKQELDEDMKSRKNVPLQLRVKPTWKDIERERTLRKVATRGVVQLFNAVRIQQKDLKLKLQEAGPLDSRQDAVLNNINKRKFLDVLMSGNRAQSQAIDNPVKFEKLKKEEPGSSNDETDEDNDNGKKKSEWNVLRDDFMTNKKIKHWDEEDQDSANSDQQANTDGESDKDE